jgi:hypothetical protein
MGIIAWIVLGALLSGFLAKAIFHVHSLICRSLDVAAVRPPPDEAQSCEVVAAVPGTLDPDRAGGFQRRVRLEKKLAHLTEFKPLGRQHVCQRRRVRSSPVRSPELSVSFT